MDEIRLAVRALYQALEAYEKRGLEVPPEIAGHLESIEEWTAFED